MSNVTTNYGMLLDFIEFMGIHVYDLIYITTKLAKFVLIHLTLKFSHLESIAAAVKVFEPQTAALQKEETTVQKYKLHKMNLIFQNLKPK